MLLRSSRVGSHKTKPFSISQEISRSSIVIERQDKPALTGMDASQPWHCFAASDATLIPTLGIRDREFGLSPDRGEIERGQARLRKREERK